MCDQTEISYLPGEVVWVKWGPVWWPGIVANEEDIPDDVSFKIPPIAIVKFFQEEGLEYVKNLSNIYHYNCLKKSEFIKKGLELYRANNRKSPANMKMFPADVAKAEVMTGGDPNILHSEEFQPEKKSDYSDLFQTSPKKASTPKKGNKSGEKEKISSPIERMITHPRFLKGLGTDHEVKNLPQYEACSKGNQGQGQYKCKQCDYSTSRINLLVIHTRSHARNMVVQVVKKRVGKESPPRKAIREKEEQGSAKKRRGRPSKKGEAKVSIEQTVDVKEKRGRKRGASSSAGTVKKEPIKLPLKKRLDEFQKSLLADWDSDGSDEEMEGINESKVEDQKKDGESLEVDEETKKEETCEASIEDIKMNVDEHEDNDEEMKELLKDISDKSKKESEENEALEEELQMIEANERQKLQVELHEKDLSEKKPNESLKTEAASEVNVKDEQLSREIDALLSDTRPSFPKVDAFKGLENVILDEGVVEIPAENPNASKDIENVSILEEKEKEKEPEPLPVPPVVVALPKPKPKPLAIPDTLVVKPTATVFPLNKFPGGVFKPAPGPNRPLGEGPLVAGGPKLTNIRFAHSASNPNSSARVAIVKMGDGRTVRIPEDVYRRAKATGAKIVVRATGQMPPVTLKITPNPGRQVRPQMVTQIRPATGIRVRNPEEPSSPPKRDILAEALENTDVSEFLNEGNRNGGNSSEDRTDSSGAESASPALNSSPQ